MRSGQSLAGLAAKEDERPENGDADYKRGKKKIRLEIHYRYFYCKKGKKQNELRCKKAPPAKERAAQKQHKRKPACKRNGKLQVGEEENDYGADEKYLCGHRDDEPVHFRLMGAG